MFQFISIDCQNKNEGSNPRNPPVKTVTEWFRIEINENWYPKNNNESTVYYTLMDVCRM